MLQRSILQYFPPSLSYHLSLRPLFYLFLSGRLRQDLLYSVLTGNQKFTSCKQSIMYQCVLIEACVLNRLNTVYMNRHRDKSAYWKTSFFIIGMKFYLLVFIDV